MDCSRIYSGWGGGEPNALGQSWARTRLFTAIGAASEGLGTQGRAESAPPDFSDFIFNV